MILAAMAACLLIPSLVQSTPWQPHPYADSPYASYGAPPITYNQKKYDVPKYEQTEPSYEVPKYGPEPAPIYTTPAPTSRYSVPTEKPYEEHKPSESYGKIEPEFAAVLIGGCDKCRGIEASAVYSPNVKSSIVPASPLRTCTLPAGVFYNDSLIVCGSGCQAIGTPCYTNKIGCDTWEEMAPIREYRERFTMTVVESCNA